MTSNSWIKHAISIMSMSSLDLVLNSKLSLTSFFFYVYFKNNESTNSERLYTIYIVYSRYIYKPEKSRHTSISISSIFNSLSSVLWIYT